MQDYNLFAIGNSSLTCLNFRTSKLYYKHMFPGLSSFVENLDLVTTVCSN